MTGFTAADNAFMARALRLAKRGAYSAHPNPMVGCVIVADGAIVGEGYHELAGEAHAEINALTAAAERARGATAYVTLEPCVHHGKTPPCAAALREAGIAQVVAALEDPYPEMRGRGLEALRDAGIEVRVGLMVDSVRSLLAGFLRRVTQGRPFVRLKIAASLDGSTAMLNSDSKWISGPDARADVQRFRARSGAIMTGIGTVLADDPSLTVRDPAIDTQGRQPLRVVVDSALRMPPSAKMLALPGQTVIYCGDKTGWAPLAAAGAEVVEVGGAGHGLDLQGILEDLGSREVNDVLVEAGPTLAGAILEARLVDELVIYQAPHIMGSETTRMFRTPAWTELADRAALEITDLRRIGDDMRITARLAEPD